MRLLKYTQAGAMLFMFLPIAFSQINDNRDSVFVFGIVRDMELMETMPFVKITRTHKMDSLSLDQDGHYGFYSGLSDTIIFHQNGYENRVFILRDTIFTGGSIYLEVLMKLKPVELSEARIMPYATYSQFKSAFLNLKTNDIQTASSNRNTQVIKSQMNKVIPTNDALHNYQNTMTMKDKNNNAFVILSTDFNKGLFWVLKTILKDK